MRASKFTCLGELGLEELPGDECDDDVEEEEDEVGDEEDLAEEEVGGFEGAHSVGADADVLVLDEDVEEHGECYHSEGHEDDGAVDGRVVLEGGGDE